MGKICLNYDICIKRYMEHLPSFSLYPLEIHTASGPPVKSQNIQTFMGSNTNHIKTTHKALNNTRYIIILKKLQQFFTSIRAGL